MNSSTGVPLIVGHLPLVKELHASASSIGRPISMSTTLPGVLQPGLGSLYERLKRCRRDKVISSEGSAPTRFAPDVQGCPGQSMKRADASMVGMLTRDSKEDDEFLTPIELAMAGRSLECSSTREKWTCAMEKTHKCPQNHSDAVIGGAFGTVGHRPLSSWEDRKALNGGLSPAVGSNYQETTPLVPRVSGIALEAYAEIYESLTKGDTAVQAVAPAEESFYKTTDLKQARMLQLPG